ncbi:hypothetical protein HPP92_000960 [Vanilla planifolia]|uniref:RING-type domain-containing protein n=1 Tax=Vanilla planifolia TaxID=51239 RepID=A0A835VL44_VANPL|nr:hypothetical protein HPP92_000960 [Vanilla planifolia]
MTLETEDDPYNGKILLAAVICLSFVVLFVVLLHAYGRWLLRRSRDRAAASASAANEARFHHRWRSSAERAGFWARDDGCHGLDAKVVAALPEFVNGEKGKVVDCVVCLSAMQEGEKGRLLPRCGHGFHAPCIDAWLRWHSTCPICRAAVQGEATVEEVVVVVEGGDLVGGSGVVQETEARGGACHGIQIDAKEEAAAAASAAVAAAATPMSSSSSSSVVSSSLKRMLSKSRSEKRVSPSAIGN